MYDIFASLAIIVLISMFFIYKDVSDYRGWRRWGILILSIVSGIISTVFTLMLLHSAMVGIWNSTTLINWGGCFLALMALSTASVALLNFECFMKVRWSFYQGL